MSDSVRSHRRQPTRLPHPWDSPGKNTGVGCHFLLQCIKVRSESEFAQSCPTPSDPTDCSLPGSSIHGISQARTLEWVAISSPMHGSESEVAQSCPTLLDPMDCSLPGSSIHGICQARVLEWGAIAFLGKDCSKEEINTFSLEVDRNQEIFDFTPSLFSIKEA